MILSRLLPPGEPVDSAELDALYALPREDWLRINLITSVDGRAAGADGTSGSLTGGADRKVLGAIRRAADVILVGASSVRAEGYLPPRSAAVAVVTASGDLDGHRLSGAEPDRLIVLCPPGAVTAVERSLGPGAARIVPMAARSGRLSTEDMVARLRSLGHRSIVCEGGPSLAGQLIGAGLVDELCLSTSPVIAGTGLPLIGDAASATPLRLTRLLADEAGFTYARWTIQRSRAS